MVSLSATRIRLTVALTAMGLVGLELALMRELSLRYWQHFAYLVISVALLGIGASGSALSLARVHLLRPRWKWLFVLALCFSLSVPFCHQTARLVPLNPPFLAWNFGAEFLHIVLIQLVMLVPFFLSGGVIGLALMDRPDRLGGHYAANLIGSGLGSLGAVLLMNVLETPFLFMVVALLGYAGALAAIPKGCGPAMLRRAVVGGALLAVALWSLPREAFISPYKMLPQVKAMPGTRVVATREGPLGRLDVVEGQWIHYAPGLSLLYDQHVPPHRLLLADGDPIGAVYNCEEPDDWRFMDYTTGALPYHLRKPETVLVIGGGGGGDIGLAVYHGVRQVRALEMNSQIIATMRGPLRDKGGGIYGAAGVRVINQEARGYLAAKSDVFDLIQLPALEAFGASGAGLYASQESYLYTVESFQLMLDRLGQTGLLCVTRWARTPPSGELRVFDLAVAALRNHGLPAEKHLAMIRSWGTVTVLVSKRALGGGDLQAIRAFCDRRGFDLCYLPGLRPGQANRHHILEQADYFQAARNLLGPARQDFLDNYVFEVSAPRDDRPFFFHFFKWRGFVWIREHLGGQSPAYWELGYILLVAALVQSVLLALLLILLPVWGFRRRLIRRKGARRKRPAAGGGAMLVYFISLGAGFMFLEMAFLHRFILYLAHPIYSAAAVIASFLVFAGIGSQLSGKWKFRSREVILAAGSVVMLLAFLCTVALAPWLSLTQSWPLWGRFGVGVLTVAPLAVAMGHMFPVALRQISKHSSSLVPFAWAVNGCSSVVATVAAPLLAMSFGFVALILMAAICYAAAMAAVSHLPKTTP